MTDLTVTSGRKNITVKKSVNSNLPVLYSATFPDGQRIESVVRRDKPPTHAWRIEFKQAGGATVTRGGFAESQYAADMAIRWWERAVMPKKLATRCVIEC